MVGVGVVLGVVCGFLCCIGFLSVVSALAWCMTGGC